MFEKRNTVTLLILFYFIFAFLPLSGISRSLNLTTNETRISKNLKKKIKEELKNIKKLEKKIRILKKEEEAIWKLYITLLIRKKEEQQNLFTILNPDFSKLLEKEEQLRSTQEVLLYTLLQKERTLKWLKKIKETKIEKLKEELEKVKKEEAKKLANLFKYGIIINPVKGRACFPGNYTENIKEETRILSPISGKVTGIKYQDGFLVEIKGKNCSAVVKNIDVIEVGLGQKLKYGEVIGKVKKPKLLKWSVKCKK